MRGAAGCAGGNTKTSGERLRRASWSLSTSIATVAHTDEAPGSSGPGPYPVPAPTRDDRLTTPGDGVPPARLRVLPARTGRTFRVSDEGHSVPDLASGREKTGTGSRPSVGRNKAPNFVFISVKDHRSSV